jgi:hypothetical protein
MAKNEIVSGATGREILISHVITEEGDKVVREYGAIEGADQTLDRLEEFLSKMVKDDKY